MDLPRPRSHLQRVPRGLAPRLWASWKPFGLGEARPNNFGEVFRAIWENRGQLRYAWRILSRGVCDGCALGTKGLHDWTLDGIHLCNIRLRLLRLNTLPALDPALLADVGRLVDLGGAQLRALGRLPYPMLRRRGEPGFRRIGWDEALDLAAAAIRAATPDRLGFYLTSRGVPNETYYVAQKALRALGSSNIDNAARVCHAPSTVALKGILGVGASTCSYGDWIGTDLLVFVGANPANNQPVALKYLYLARKAGTRIVLVNTLREPGMERYWIPSTVESALFGTQLAERTFLVDVGGDAAFFNAVLKRLIEIGGVNQAFVDAHTTGFDVLAAALADQSWDDLVRASGSSRQDIDDFAALLAGAPNAVFIWSMGATQHVSGEDNVRALVNVALARGYVGREMTGLMPIRGHSGVQGGAEMGAYATALPGGLPVTAEHAAHFAALWGFPVPAEPGLTTAEMLDAALAGRLDLLWAMGGNFLDVLPDPAQVRQALEHIPLRVHQDIVVSSQMLVEPADTVLLLPAATRYEVPGGVTETTTERRIVLSPEIPGPRVGEARPEWEVFLDLARRARPDLADRLALADTAAVRADIARAVPFYDGIQHLTAGGDQVQYGGERLCEGGHFPLPEGRARFAVVVPDFPAPLPPGHFRLTTRRGKQFNSMVHEHRDALNNHTRESVLMSAEDAAALGLASGDPITLVNEVGRLTGVVALAGVKPGNLAVHWPEGNVLIAADRRSPVAQVPDYNAVVRVEPG